VGHHDEVLTAGIFEERYGPVFLRQIRRLEAVLVLESLVDLWRGLLCLLAGSLGLGG